MEETFLLFFWDVEACGVFFNFQLNAAPPLSYFCSVRRMAVEGFLQLVALGDLELIKICVDSLGVNAHDAEGVRKSVV